MKYKIICFIGAFFISANLSYGFTGREYPIRWEILSSKKDSEVIRSEKAFILAVSGTTEQDLPGVSCGAYLDLKYFSGLTYAELIKILPGKSISADIYIPKATLRCLVPGEPRVRIIAKSSSGDKWYDLPSGGGWKNISPGKYNRVSLTVPEKPVETDGLSFDPAGIRAIAVELWTGSLKPGTENIFFMITNIKIGDIPFDISRMNWQKIKRGETIEHDFLNSYPAKSSLVLTEGNVLLKGPIDDITPDMPGPGKESFISIPVHMCNGHIPEKAALTARLAPGDEAAATIEIAAETGIPDPLNLIIPLVPDTASAPQPGALAGGGLSLDFLTDTGPAKRTVPFVIELPRLLKGRTVPFDGKWEQRDIQGLGGYVCIDESGDTSGCGITITRSEKDPYRIFATLKMQGGINWTNPFYRAELKRDLDGAPVDMKDSVIELTISPATDTTELWQEPYRARLGLLDINDKVMFGPNISLSEGLPAKAFLNVTLAAPTPKGLVMPGFDPGKIKSILINMEATFRELPPMDLSIYLSDLTVYKTPAPHKSRFKKIDFTRLKRDPSKWVLNEILKKNGGYTVGINYPFPTISIPKNVLEVPQIYPTTGRKPNDPGHFGFSSDITYSRTLGDFLFFASKNIEIVRVFTLGHLGGVFLWDVTGKDISGFDKNQETLLGTAIGLPVEELPGFFEKNEITLFPGDTSIQSLNRYVLKDFTALLEILEKVEKKTGKRIVIILTLYDFTFADTIEGEGPFKKYEVGEHPEIVTVPLTRIKSYSIIWKMIRILDKDPRFRRYIGAIDIINEPSNAVALAAPATFTQLVDFAGETLYLVKSIVNPDIPVTIGFRSWLYDLEYWKSVNEGVDILMPHYWESLESYNIDNPGLWPLDTPADDLWAIFGTEKDGRLTAMGEISPVKGTIKNNLERLRKAGYDFALIWSYSGHDGFDGKAVIDDIAEINNK